MKNKISLLAVLGLLASGVCAYAQTQSVTLTTYYPAPFGAYDRLQLVPRDPLSGSCTIGTMYVQSPDVMRFCRDDGTGTGTWGGLGIWTQAIDPDDATNKRQFVFLSDTVNAKNARVGIGTDTPQTALHVVHDDSTTPTMVTLHNLRADNNTNSNISWVFGPAANPFLLASLKAVGENIANSGALASHISFWTTSPAGFWTSADPDAEFANNGYREAMTIGATGNVGIGDKTPKALLEISGNKAVRDATNPVPPYLMISSERDENQTGGYEATDGDVFVVRANGTTDAKGRVNVTGPLASEGCGPHTTSKTEICLSDSGQTEGYGAGVFGGQDGRALAEKSAVLGGEHNYVTGGDSAIIGGGTNQVSSGLSVVVGGHLNNSQSDMGVILGGRNNTLGSSNVGAIILSGWGNAANGLYAMVLGGGTSSGALPNSAIGDRAVVINGVGSKASANDAIAIGPGIEAAANNTIAVSLDSALPANTKVAQANTMAIMGGKVGIGTTAPKADLEVKHTLRLTPRVNVPFACDFEHYGTIYFDSTNSGFWGCNDTGWRRLDDTSSTP